VQQPLVISHRKVCYSGFTHNCVIAFFICYIIIDGRAPTDDYSAFNDVWDKPDGGMHKYLHRFLTSPDATFQHIAVWTIVQLLESGGQS
jgi:hypothetical protein